MGDLTAKERSSTTRIVGGDELNAADVLNIGGINRVATTTTISSVQIPLGKDPLPDTFFIITNAGAIGDTIRIQIAATANDSSSPDRDLPAVDYTYTLVAGDVGDELALATNFENGVNADVNFQNAFLEAQAIARGDGVRAIVHVSSTIFSLDGEFVERPTAGDVAVSVTGTTTISLNFDGTQDRLISRPKEVSLSRDPNNPHRLGVQNISGSVRLTASNIEQILKEYLAAVIGGSTEMIVDGSVTPVAFRISSDPVSDKLVESLKFIITDGTIKVGTSNFLGQNSALANGVTVDFYKDGVLVYAEPLIRDTNDILGQWATDAADNKIISQPSGDYLESTFNLVDNNLQFQLEAGENDYIEVVIQDDLTNIQTMRLLAGGFLE
jgi:hypothetical protein